MKGQPEPDELVADLEPDLHAGIDLPKRARAEAGVNNRSISHRLAREVPAHTGEGVEGPVGVFLEGPKQVKAINERRSSRFQPRADRGF